MNHALRKSRAPASVLRGRRGLVFVHSLLLLSISTLIAVPFLDYLTTGIIVGREREEEQADLYAADAGIEDGLWRIQYQGVSEIVPAYDPYDFASTWTYDLPEEPNGRPVEVTLKNAWVPKGLAVPGSAEAQNIIESGRLVVSGSMSGTNSYTVKITWYPDEDEDLFVQKIGVWIPAGFSYVEGSSTMENPSQPYYSIPETSDHAGGQAVIWEFAALLFEEMPGANPGPTQVAEFTFDFSTSLEKNPQIVAWIETSGVSAVPYSWDADAKVFQIISRAGKTEIEAHASATIPRQLGAAIGGDYKAVGASLMIDAVPDSGGPDRDTLLAENDATVSGIASTATVKLAYLYWSAWLNNPASSTLFQDSGTNFNNWTKTGTTWQIVSNTFRGHAIGPEADRYLTLNTTLDLSGGGMAKLRWDQWESGSLESADALRFQISGDGGTTWSSIYTAFSDDIGALPQAFAFTVPEEYATTTFKVRFYLASFLDSNEYAFVDNIRVTYVSTSIADATATFKVDGQQVYFDGAGQPVQGAGVLTAESCQLLENKPDTYSYACRKDVTLLLRTYSEIGSFGNPTGNGTYTAGGIYGDILDEWAYAGWSLVVVYASPDTRGHQLYLYDDFKYAHHYTNIDFDDDGSDGGVLSGFLVPPQIPGETTAAKLTAFIGEGDGYYSGEQFKVNGTALSDGQSSTNVWNSWSQGFSDEGVDVDTFEITWASGILQTGDTSAVVEMPTGVDVWNLVYIIMSFRSEITTGGTMSYIIRKA